MESWLTQLITLLAVVVGALSSFIATSSLDRYRWRREETIRWDAKRLECYSQYSTAMMNFITIAYRITANLGFPATAHPLDVAEGLAILATSDQELRVRREQILMLGSPEVIAAADAWRDEARHLEWFARGLRDNPDEYTQTTNARRAAQRRYYSAVRADLGVLSGQVPIHSDMPNWRETPSSTKYTNQESPDDPEDIN